MKILANVIAILICLASPAVAAPWVISGQTNIAAGTSIDNPTPADTGAIGAVTSLAFTVPDGKVVCINSYTMEGYDAQGIAVLFVWTGSVDGMSAAEASAYRAAHGLPSAAGDAGHGQISDMNYCFPAGTIINVRLINGTSYGGVYGWGVWGTIEDAA